MQPFYINYVGCKVSTVQKLEAAGYAFILTMWDVKRSFTIEGYNIQDAFILTMWDVKIVNKALVEYFINLLY